MGSCTAGYVATKLKKRSIYVRVYVVDHITYIKSHFLPNLVFFWIFDLN